MLETQHQVDFNAVDIIDDFDEWQTIEEDEDDRSFVAEELPFDEESIDVPRIKEEINTLEGFIAKARKITHESKADALLAALNEAFKMLKEEGAERKALIFTESTKTQVFLREMLENNGYEGKVVLFNGKASEPQTNKIYQDWCGNHPDKVSGIKAADRRAAIVDYFRNKAEVMIATEAASEGLNLQFCSLIINYDLPWNPQRIEQRIGRCHRYGQKFDVVVVNFINERNYADVRVFELLSNKFKLFDDVFGASDEVLGRADSLDIENRIWEIYQQCRSDEEIQSAFEKLQADMQEEIDEKMDTVRSEVLENFHINVQQHLRTRKDDTGVFLNRYQHVFWELTKYVLSAHAVFNDENHTFLLKTPVAGQRKGLYSLLNSHSDAQTYRLNDPLGQHVINSALSMKMDDDVCILFDENALEMNAQLPDYMHNRSGYMLLSRLSVSAMDDEQYNLFTAFTDDGEFLTQEDCENLFLNGGTESRISPISDAIVKKLELNQKQHSKSKLQELDSRNLSYFKQEEERILKWEHDMLDDLEVQIRQLRAAINQAEREARNAANIQDKLTAERKVDELKRKRRRLRNDMDDREDEIGDKRKQMIKDIESKLIQNISHDNIFMIRWQTK